MVIRKSVRVVTQSVSGDVPSVKVDGQSVSGDVPSHRSAAKSDKTEEKKMPVFKKREKEDGVKSNELKRSTENRTEDVGVKDASITLKSALKLKDKKSKNGEKTES